MAAMTEGCFLAKDLESGCVNGRDQPPEQGFEKAA